MTSYFRRLVVLGLSAVALAASPARAGVLEYASAHPVPDAALSAPPTVGDSVPAGVELQVPAEGGPYGYFYFNGQPVIVDLATRAVVRVGG